MAGMTVMRQQMTFVQQRDIGYNTDHVVVVPTNDLDGEQLVRRFQDALAGRPEILGVTGMTSAFSHGYSREGWSYGDEQKSAYLFRVESNFVDVMGVNLVAGRNLDSAYPADSTQSVLVNEALVRDFGWEEPVGQVLRGFYAEPVVVGVVRDVNFQSLHNAVEPMVFTMHPDWGISHLLVRVRPDDTAEALDEIRSTWATQAPDVPFKYSFLDEDLARQYASEARWSKIVAYSSFFAIVIACLGLFGLASISVTSRTKEIGIRRALGASVTGLAARLSGDFIRLVAIATLFAVPLAWFGLERWLDQFAFRVTVSVFVFALAAGLSLFVALLTVGIQTVRAARTDPVDSLRTE